MNTERVACIAAEDACSALAIAGRAGRAMSVESGGSVESAPSSTTNDADVWERVVARTLS